MKQTSEEAAHSFAESRSSGSAFPAYYQGFVAGAEWHARQSPWISVKERLPETDDGQSLYEVIVATSDKRFLVVINTEVEHLVGLLGVTHWMYIPSFDEILEANRDVLERIKEKGD